MDIKKPNSIKRDGEAYRPQPSIGGTAQDTADRLPPPQKPQSNPTNQNK